MRRIEKCVPLSGNELQIPGLLARSPLIILKDADASIIFRLQQLIL